MDALLLVQVISTLVLRVRVFATRKRRHFLPLVLLSAQHPEYKASGSLFACPRKTQIRGQKGLTHVPAGIFVQKATLLIKSSHLIIKSRALEPLTMNNKECLDFLHRIYLFLVSVTSCDQSQCFAPRYCGYRITSADVQGTCET